MVCVILRDEVGSVVVVSGEEESKCWRDLGKCFGLEDWFLRGRAQNQKVGEAFSVGYFFTDRAGRLWPGLCNTNSPQFD